MTEGKWWHLFLLGAPYFGVEFSTSRGITNRSPEDVVFPKVVKRVCTSWISSRKKCKSWRHPEKDSACCRNKRDQLFSLCPPRGDRTRGRVPTLDGGTPSPGGDREAKRVLATRRVLWLLQSRGRTSLFTPNVCICLDVSDCVKLKHYANAHANAENALWLRHNRHYRLGPVNSNTVNSKFHLIQIFAKIFATFLSFHC